MSNKTYGFFIVLAIVFAACSKSNDVTPVQPVPTPVDTTSTPIPSPAKETFESGTKSSYNDSVITLSTGKWSFSNAVIGNTADDRKNDAKSARIQETGRITMNFDIVNGVFRVVVKSGTYGTDGPSTWQLWASFNSGYSYEQMGSNITTSSSTLQSDTIVVNSIAKARFSIRKISGGSNRLNIDDIEAILTSAPLAPNFADNNHMLLGNADNADQSILATNNHYYMDKGYYSLSYNSETRIPNWVSWHLGTSDIGTTPRQDDFRADDALPVSWYHVTDASYAGSGFDRGHACPSNDRTSSVPANSSTFLMTNMFPQAPNLNQGPWQKLEDSCNKFLTQGKEVYIICGSYGTGGTGNNGFLSAIDNERVSVPAHMWKVVVVLSNGNNDLSRIDNSTRVIAVDMPNENSIGISSDWKNFRVSVNSIEAVTGLNLLSNISEAIQNVVEDRIDNL